MKKLIFALFFLLFSTYCHAATYYVDADSSGGDGTTQATSGANAAFATIAAVNAATFAAGDSVLFQTGDTWTLTSGTRLTIDNKGTSGSYITFGSYGTGAKPIIDGNNAQDYGVVVADDGVGNYYVEIKDLEIKNCVKMGLTVGATADAEVSYHVKLTNLTIHDCTTYNAIRVNASNVIIDNCELYNIGEDGIFLRGDDIEIKNCNLYDFDIRDGNGDGIQFSDDAVNDSYWIHDNTVTHPGTGTKGCFIAEGGGAGGIIENNVFTNGAWSVLDDNVGTIVRNNLCSDITGYAIHCHSANGQYYNNVIINTPVAFLFNQDVTGVKIHHNTVVGVTNRCVGKDENITSDFEFKNNIVTLTGAGRAFIISIGGTSSITSDYNCFYPDATNSFALGGSTYSTLATFVAGSGQDTHSIATDPDLTSAYYLKSGSPCIDGGTSVGITTDYDSNSRPAGAGTDIGAREFGTFVYDSTLNIGSINWTLPSQLYGCTFYKDFTAITPGTYASATYMSLLNADFSVGSPTATFTSTDGNFVITAAGYQATTANDEVLKYAIANNRTAATETIVIKFTLDGTAHTADDYHLQDTDTKQRDMKMRTFGSGTIRIAPNFTDAATVYAISTFVPDVSTTYVLSAVFQTASPNVNLYFNGISDITSTTNTWNGSMAWGTYFYIGCRKESDKQLKGVISSVAIFSRALTQAELLALNDLM